MGKAVAAAILILAFGAVARAQTAQTPLAFETAMHEPVSSLVGAMWNLADASRGTCSSSGVTNTCSSNAQTYAKQLTTAQWDAFELDWAMVREEMWAEGVNHTMDVAANGQYTQPFFSYHTATCSGVTYDADTDPAGAIECDQKNAEALVTAVEADFAALPSNLPNTPATTATTYWNTYVAAAKKNLASLSAQWTAAEAAAALLPGTISYPSTQIRTILYDATEMIFQMGTGGCDAPLAKIATGGAANLRIGCGHAAAMMLEKLTYQPNAAVSLDEYMNVLQNCAFETSYISAVQATFMAIPGAQSQAQAIAYALEPLDKTPYRIDTDDDVVIKMINAEGAYDSLLVQAEMFQSAGWHATDAMAWNISCLIWPELGSVS